MYKYITPDFEDYQTSTDLLNIIIDKINEAQGLDFNKIAVNSNIYSYATFYGNTPLLINSIYNISPDFSNGYLATYKANELKLVKRDLTELFTIAFDDLNLKKLSSEIVTPIKPSELKSGNFILNQLITNGDKKYNPKLSLSRKHRARQNAIDLTKKLGFTEVGIRRKHYNGKYDVMILEALADDIKKKYNYK